jgi:hypothetical protein
MSSINRLIYVFNQQAADPNAAPFKPGSSRVYGHQHPPRRATRDRYDKFMCVSMRVLLELTPNQLRVFPNVVGA